MRQKRARLKAKSFTVAAVACCFVGVAGPAAWSQVELDDPVQDVVSEVEDQVSDVTGTVSSTTESITETAESVADSVESSATTDGVDGSTGGLISAESTTGASDSPTSRGETASSAMSRPTAAGHSGSGLARGASGPGSRSSGQGGATGARLARQQATSPITVLKTNDADGDGRFFDAEAASTPGEAVTFRAFVMNFGPTPLRITRVVDTYTVEGRSIQTEVCPELGGSVLEPLGSTTCAFELQDYAPPIGAEVVNVVTVSTVPTEGDPVITSGNDRSTVTTSGAGQPPVVRGKTILDSLASTGLAAIPLILAVVALASSGTSFLAASRRRARLAK
jgi:hypothetical protein